MHGCPGGPRRALGVPDVAEIVVTAVMLLVGSTVASTVGFGIGLTTIPVLLLVLDPQTTVVVVNTVSLLLFGAIAVQARRSISLRTMAPVCAAGLAGVPVGVFFLNSVNEGALRIGIAALIIVLTFTFAIDLDISALRSRVAGPVAGFAASVLITASGIGGPLLALYLLAQGWPRHSVRGSLALFFLVIESTAAVGYVATGIFDLERLVLTSVAAVPVLIGSGLGAVVASRMNETVFRYAAMTMIVTASVVVLAREAIAF